MGSRGGGESRTQRFPQVADHADVSGGQAQILVLFFSSFCSIKLKVILSYYFSKLDVSLSSNAVARNCILLVRVSKFDMLL